MTQTLGSRADPLESTDAAIVAALRADPAFFLRHPELVAELEVPHDAGRAVSLVRHQVDVLQRARRRSEIRLDALMDNARGNERLARRVHALLLDLIGSRSLDALLDALQSGLRHHLGAEHVALRLFFEVPSSTPRPEIAGSQARGPFEDLLVAGAPRCGRGRAEELQALFGETASEIRSSAVVPLPAAIAPGVLGLASVDPQRLRPGMATDYLRQLGELVAALVAARL